MTFVKLNDNRWLDTSHVVGIFRHSHNDSLGAEHETYTLMLDNNETMKLTGAQGDFIINSLGIISDPGGVTTGASMAPKGYQQITTLTSSTGLTVPAGSTFAIIQVEEQGVRYRDDDTAPTATVGMPLASGSILEYDGSLSAIRFIQQASGAKLNVLYYG